MAQYGTDPALLVKLLDAGERLPVHVHPDRAFARNRLGLAHGKTEAWLIVEARSAHPTVWLGFREDVDIKVLAGWVDRQKRSSMLDALNELTVALETVRRRALRRDEHAELKRQTKAAPESRPGARTVIPTAVTSFFRAERLRPAPAVKLERAFSILVVVDGDGRLETEDGTAMLSRGKSLLVPHAAGPGELTGSIDVIRCLPPAPNGDPRP